jgi:beta-glucosidase
VNPLHRLNRKPHELSDTSCGETIAAVERGEVPMSRIDDAVTRILRVKLRAGLFDAPRPSLRAHAGNAGNADKLVAREAARKSAVLLKNDAQLLPMKHGAKVLVVGKSADSLPNQSGGWLLGWQGAPPVDRNTNASFPNGQTVLAGIEELLGRDNVVHDPTGTRVDPAPFDVVVAVIGELPYAEFGGDILWNPLVDWRPMPRDYVQKQTLEHAVRHPEDLAVLDAVRGRGVPVVTIVLSGRPLYTNKEINRSDAFVAAFLPGTEAGGLAALLFRGADGPAVGFWGRLSYSWPGEACQTSLNVGQTPYTPLFPFGYGLRHGDVNPVPELPETAGPPAGCTD